MYKFFGNVRRYSLPVLMIAAGVAILIAHLNDTNWQAKTWPFFILLPGITMLLLAWESKEPRMIRLIFPGTIVTGTGLILLYQVLTDHWHSWTYAWALYATFFGMGLVFQGRRTQDKGDIRMGRLMIVGGVAVFGLLWLLFETVVFGETYAEIRGYLVSGVLIAGGVIWGGNRLRVQRVLARQAVIAGQEPAGKPIKPEGRPRQPERIGQHPSDISDAPVIQAPVPADRALPSGGDVPSTDDVPPQEAPPRASTDSRVAAEPASTRSVGSALDDDDIEDAIISEYRPPKEITVDGAEPNAEISQDLQAKIAAALKEEAEVGSGSSGQQPISPSEDSDKQDESA